MNNSINIRSEPIHKLPCFRNRVLHVVRTRTHRAAEVLCIAPPTCRVAEVRSERQKFKPAGEAALIMREVRSDRQRNSCRAGSGHAVIAPNRRGLPEGVETRRISLLRRLRSSAGSQRLINPIPLLAPTGSGPPSDIPGSEHIHDSSAFQPVCATKEITASDYLHGRWANTPGLIYCQIFRLRG